MKKILLLLLIVAVIVQLFVPAYMIWERFDVLKSGDEVKIAVRPIDPYDAFRGRYVALRFDYDLDYSERNGQYGVLEVDENNFAKVVCVTKKKPDTGLYLVSDESHYFTIPLDRYYMEETLAPKAEAMLNNSQAYITVRIKGDKAVISGLYINNTKAEDLLTR